jgi:hypothetical protein
MLVCSCVYLEKMNRGQQIYIYISTGYSYGTHQNHTLFLNIFLNVPVPCLENIVVFQILCCWNNVLTVRMSLPTSRISPSLLMGRKPMRKQKNKIQKKNLSFLGKPTIICISIQKNP